MHNKSMILFIALAVAPFAWPLPSSSAAAQIRIIPGSAVTGAQIFNDKGCSNCHKFENMANNETPSSLAAALWNHSPQMWSAQQKGNVRPVLNSSEAADVFAYFFSLSYTHTPGDPSKGKAVFEAKTCAGCHDTQIGKRRSGPPISTWSEVDDPLSWAERMWNHSNSVYRELSNSGLPWPQFSSGDMVDMLAYLRSVQTSPAHATFQPGDAEKGRITFENRCESCHSFGDRTAVPKVDLLKRPAPDTLIGYVAAMWNHAPLMRQRAGDDFPVFGPGDMSNLVAYLFAQRYFEKEGNAARGARVFETKGCASCHERLRRETGAPDLTMANERYSPITVAASLFRHGPAMLERMEKQNVSWPRFTAAEMEDVIAFLNSRLVQHVATAPE
jgi:cytochrome c2